MNEKCKSTKTKLELLSSQDVLSEEDSDSNEESQDVFEDITLSDDSDDEKKGIKHSLRRKRKSQKLKRNDLGETPLHKACIEGNFSFAKILVERGENINIRDNAGWTPLHEACNHGHYRIVEYLLDHGANLNDRGGEKCNGTTPLHDAALNGNLDIMKLLISKGASVTILNNDGQTALQILLEWKQEEDRDEETLKQCENIENLLKTKMDSVGQVDNFSSYCNIPNTDSYESIPVLPDTFSGTQKAKQADKRCHSSSSSSSESELSDHSPVNSQQHIDWEESDGATLEYKNVMSNLRQSAKTMNRELQPTHKPSNIPALINEDDIVNDWLIKDTGQKAYSKKKRKKVARLNVSKSKSLYNYLSANNKSPSSNLPVSSDESENFTIESCSNDMPVTYSNSHREASIKEQDNQPGKNIKDSILSFCLRVRISGNLILVPIADDAASAGYLAEEAAKRYYDMIGNKPILKITKDGALLHNSDVIKTLFENNEEVLAIIESWEEQSLEQHYIHSCSKQKLIPLVDVKKKLATSDKELNLSYTLIPLSHLNMVFAALSKYSKLQHLDLSGLVMNESCFDLFICCFSSFESLIFLNVSCCGLTFEIMKKIYNHLTNPNEDAKSLPNLRTLFLTNNLLFSTSSCGLLSLIKLPSITTIDAKSCHLDLNLFDDLELCESLRNWKNLEEFNMAQNALGHQGVKKLLSCLAKNNLKKLDLSHTVSENGDLALHVSDFLSNGLNFLKELNLESCHLMNKDLDTLATSLSKCRQIQKCNISSNPHLSANSICTFVRTAFCQNQLPVELVLTGTCRWDSENIVTLKNALQCKMFRYICLDNISAFLQTSLFRAWEEIWSDKAMCLSLSSMFCKLGVT